MERTRRHDLSVMYVMMIVFGVTGMLLSSLTYMAKDYNYYNILYRFFNIGRETSLTLTRWPVSQRMLLRILNVSNVLFYLGFFLYAMKYTGSFNGRLLCGLKAAAWIVALVQLVFLDPSVTVFLYMRRILFWADVAFYRAFYAVLTVAIRIFVILICAVSFIAIGIAFFRTPAAMRMPVSVMLAIYGALTVSYLYLYRWMPPQVIWMSRVAKLVIYQSLPVGKSYGAGRVIPSLSVLLVITLALITIRQMLIYSSEARDVRIFNRKISEADTVSRVFCHYIKNEVLAQQAELRLLETKAPTELQDDILNVVARNERMYAYLNNARKIFKQEKAAPERILLKALLEEALESVQKVDRAAVELIMDPEPVYILGDRYQLLSVLTSLIKNAYEAPRVRKPFRLRIQVSRQWKYVCIAIANNGQRIARKDRKKVFEPFYSTKPSTSNWGLGLSLCKNIVILHHGKIMLTEEQAHNEIMTVFNIILPAHESETDEGDKE